MTGPSRLTRLRRAAAAACAAVALCAAVPAPAAAQTPSAGEPVPAGLNSFHSTMSAGYGDPSGVVSPGGSAGLIDMGGDLGSVDLLTGALHNDSVRAMAGDDPLSVLDMMAADQLALDAQRIAERARVEAERRKAEAEARRRNAAAPGGTQVEVGPDGCPTSAPANTLRNGSAAVGIAEICARSVAQAASPNAARAVKEALAQLGRPYSQPLRNNAGYFDCSSFITRAYQNTGTPLAPPGQNAPTTHSLLPRAGFSRKAWAVPIDASQARPGDIVFPHEGHVAMVLADGWVVHTNRTGDVSHVRSSYSSPLAFRRVDPSRV